MIIASLKEPVLDGSTAPTKITRLDPGLKGRNISAQAVTKWRPALPSDDIAKPCKGETKCNARVFLLDLISAMFCGRNADPITSVTSSNVRGLRQAHAPCRARRTRTDLRSMTAVRSSSARSAARELPCIQRRTADH